jgi:hypothetical protein
MYKTVVTQDVISGLRERGLVTEEPRVTARSRTGKTTVHLARVPLNIGTHTLFDSQVQPELLLWNSYQGESSFVAKLGFFRFVCANGMALGSSFGSVKLRHIEGPKFEREFRDFFDGIDRMVCEGFSSIEQQMSKKLTHQEREAVVRSLGFSKKTTETILQQLAVPQRDEDNTGNVWQLWNVSNEVMRQRSRSELAFERKNDRLLNDILSATEVIAA